MVYSQQETHAALASQNKASESTRKATGIEPARNYKEMERGERMVFQRLEREQAPFHGVWSKFSTKQ